MLKKPRKQQRVPEGYRDIFARDARQGPLILRNCASVEWPKGWTADDAAKYRKGRGLTPEKAD